MKCMEAWLANLLIPGDPAVVSIEGSVTTWEIGRALDFSKIEAAVQTGKMCASTYYASGTTKSNLAPTQGKLLRELRFLCIAASYLTGRAVTVSGSTPRSDFTFITVGDGFPRPRAMVGIPVVRDEQEFVRGCQAILDTLPTLAENDHVDVMCHHLLNALSGWCLEDVFLSACTVMELVKWSGRRHAGKPKLHLNDALGVAASVARVRKHPKRFSDMRNDLIHDGHLSWTNFRGKTRRKGRGACADLTAKVLLWIDLYLHARFGLGKPKVARFDRMLLESAPSFSRF